MQQEDYDVIVIGGGWSGLTSAIYLLLNGLRVLILERSSQLGGRARGINFANTEVDNGQHLMIGGYKAMHEVLNLIGEKEEDLFLRIPFSWHFYDHNSPLIKLDFLNKDTQINRLLALIKAKEIPWLKKISFLKTCNLLLKEQTTEKNLPDFYKQHNICQFIIDYFLNPLCLAAMSTPYNTACIKTFTEVLKRTLAKNSNSSDILIPKKSLSEILPNPASKYINKLGGVIKTNTSVKKIITENNKIIGVQTNSSFFKSKKVLLATAPLSAVKLLEPIQSIREITNKIKELIPVPITTIYYQFDKPININNHLIGFYNSFSQWIFDRKFCEQPNIVSIVITGKTEIESLSKLELKEKILTEIKPFLPHGANCINSKIITEKFAAFICDENTKKLRPNINTNLEGLWLTGDYCLNKLPASLEGAIENGKMAAKNILNLESKN